MKSNNKMRATISNHLLFILIGIILLVIAGCLIHSHKKFAANSVKIDGVISDIDKHREYDSDGDEVTETRVYVDFEYDDVIYEDIYVGSNLLGMDVGESVTLLYNEQKNDVKVDTLWRFDILIFGVMGLLFTGLCSFSLMNQYLSKKRIHDLMTKGQKLQTVIENIETIIQGTTNNQDYIHVYKFICVYRDELTGEQREFVSPEIQEENEIQQYNVGDKIVVYVSGDKYHIVLDEQKGEV